MMLALHRKSVLGAKGVVNVWLRPDRSGWGVAEAFTNNNLDLMLLTAYRLQRHWSAELNLVTVVGDNSGAENDANTFLAEICEVTRLPATTNCRVLVGDFQEVVGQAPKADLNITGLQVDPDFEFMKRMVDLTGSSCLFVADSGGESARI